MQNKSDSSLYVKDTAPKPLPSEGFSLLELHQYVVDPVARAIIKDIYGLTIVGTITCTRAQSDEREITTTSRNTRTGEIRTTTFTQPATDATFRAALGNSKFASFIIDLEAIKNARAAYSEADVYKDAPKQKVKPTKKDKPKLDLSFIDI